MNKLPPFDPPYQTISADFGKAMLEYVEPAEIKPASGTGKTSKNVKAAGPVTSTKDGVVFLVVPFAEKDEAKGLGARWDAANRKWYVPAGKDPAAFARWLPKD